MPGPISSRRAFVQSIAWSAATSFALKARASNGAEPQGLDENDPKARALGYVQNAKAVDTKQYPAFVPGSNCENCLKLQGAPGSSFRPCGLFPGKLVAVSGWCSGWTPEI